MAETDKPFSLQWSGGKTVVVVDKDGNEVASLSIDQCFGMVGIWGTTDRGRKWTPVTLDEKTGVIHVDSIPSTATVVYTRNAANFITSEVWTTATCVITITYTRNAANFITQTSVVVS